YDRGVDDGGVSVTDIMLMEQRDDVTAVLFIEFNDLELGQEQFGERKTEGVLGDTIGWDRNGVTELEHADEHVDVTALAVEVQESSVAVRRVEVPVRGVAQPLEHRPDT